MIRLGALFIMFFLIASAYAQTNSREMIITRSGSQTSTVGPAERFTGSVRVDPLFNARAPSRTSGAYVTFEPGARSAWHSHPLGQTLIVTKGVGRVQSRGGAVEVIREGDFVWTPPGVQHGASPDTAMTHLAISETLDGKTVDWLEKVTEAQYGVPVKGQGDIPMKDNGALSAKQQQIVAISALTAKGDLEKLRKALNDGLDAGLTINETKEVLVHTYAYCGFPRSIRGLQTLMEVLDARKLKGINDTTGRNASPIDAKGSKYERGKKILGELTKTPQPDTLTGYSAFAPTIDTFLKEHLFADIFERDVLTYAERELVTVSVISAIGNAEPMLRSHLSICLNVGLRPKQLNEFTGIISSTVGKKEGKSAQTVLNEVLKTRIAK